MARDQKPSEEFLAALNKRRKYKFNSCMRYDLMAGGVYWDDEMIDSEYCGPGMQWWRMAIAHRTDKFKKGINRYPILWHAIEVSAPNWVGLRSERIEPKGETLSNINSLLDKGEAWINSLESGLDKQNAQQVDAPESPFGRPGDL